MGHDDDDYDQNTKKFIMITAWILAIADLRETYLCGIKQITGNVGMKSLKIRWKIER